MCIYIYICVCVVCSIRFVWEAAVSSNRWVIPVAGANDCLPRSHSAFDSPLLTWVPHRSRFRSPAEKTYSIFMCRPYIQHCIIIYYYKWYTCIRIFALMILTQPCHFCLLSKDALGRWKSSCSLAGHELLWSSRFGVQPYTMQLK